MNLEQNLEQNYVPRKALQVSMNSEVEEKPLLTQYSVTDSSSEFSLIPHDSMMIETFTKSYNSFSDLGSYFTQYKDDSIEENSIAFPMSSHESSYSYTLISSGNSSMKTKQEENEERQRQVSKQICQDREEMAGKRQKGRPYKVNNAIFSLASSKYIPATYRKSLERAYKTQKPSRWCHVVSQVSQVNMPILHLSLLLTKTQCAALHTLLQSICSSVSNGFLMEEQIRFFYRITNLPSTVGEL
ncbi:hypothetical protein Gasu2_25810 [Galdieria sulphuraria]|nr:hypothetical protein Gasu2_25810 [Galdieria sulphuraria]